MMQPAPLSLTASKRVSVLGSTGSIGQSTIDILMEYPEQFQVVALTANENFTLLAEQAKRLKPELVVIGNEAHHGALKELLSSENIRIEVGANALEEAAALPCDWLMAAIVGACGLRPTLAAIQTGATIALANKECLVCGGEWLMQQVQTHKATLLPVDSEHNAIFQVFDQKNCDLIEKITLTASGGPFRDYTLEAMQSITPEEAVVHPNWDMGAKISVDSATMMNKGLELIEAYHLFPCDLEQIDILVHPESIIHSMVHYKDGSVLAQMSHPDMRTPIAHTLAWPERIEIPHTHLDFSQIQSLTFEAYDDGRFPAPMLAREVAKKGGNLPIVLNAANEIAVDRFLKGEIDFLNIIAMIEHLLEHAQYTDITSLNDIMTVDAETREIAKHLEM